MGMRGRPLAWSLLAGALAVTLPGAAMASEGVDGAAMGLAWIAPFAGLLLTIAVGQAAFPHFWERHFPKLTLAWIAATVVPLAAWVGGATAAAELAHLLVLDYLPFLMTILTLYVIAGGIQIRTRMSGHPAENMVLLALGTVAAGFMGTPGATLLFLPVLLTSNGWRRHKVHTMVFLIFLISNMGGGLTPLGPPLLMGYLKGVDFLWTVEHMLLPTAAASALLLVLYWALDSLVFFRREDAAARAAYREEHDTIQIAGGTNVLLLVLVIATVVACGNWDLKATVALGPVDLPVPDLVRLLVMALLAGASLRRTAPELRAANHFSWGPMREVAILFAGIFITMLPPLAILKAGPEGAMGGLIGLVTAADGAPINWAYFVITGILSAVLDNAPTFLVFFNVAGGDAATLMGAKAATLTAISAGAAFWGGVTYIGNAPNFMVRSMAEQRGVTMPNFFSYILWSLAILIPVFGAEAVLFFGAPVWMAAGLALMVVVGLVYARWVGRDAEGTQPARSANG